MKNILIILLFIFTSALCTATDYKCTSECQKKGYKNEYCKKHCVHKKIVKDQKADKADHTCLSDCAYNLSAYEYCKEICSYEAPGKIK